LSFLTVQAVRNCTFNDNIDPLSSITEVLMEFNPAPVDSSLFGLAVAWLDHNTFITHAEGRAIELHDL
jgi:hypothetical protein